MNLGPKAAVRAVVFDLDGTLIHSAPDLHAAANRLLAEEGRPPVTMEQVALMTGDGVLKITERAFAATGEAVKGEALDALAARYLEHYEGHETDLSRPFPGVEAALAGLKGAGLTLGVCTNKPEKPSRAILSTFGLDGYFSAVVGGDTLAGIRKPDARHLLAVVERLGARAEQSVMIGDSPNDIAGARAAGVPVIAVTFGYTRIPPAELGADALIDHFDELKDAITGLA